MAKGTRICKVCGKEYPYCKTHAPANKFRWQDVACSIECGSTYFKLVEEARRKDNIVEDTSDVEREAVVADVSENNDVYDAVTVDEDDDMYEEVDTDEDSDDEDEIDYDDEYDEIDEEIDE